jgi:hypothetical protein
MPEAASPERRRVLIEQIAQRIEELSADMLKQQQEEGHG